MTTLPPSKVDPFSLIFKHLYLLIVATERRTLTKLVIGHPLALRLAITAINNYKMGLAIYCQNWRRGTQETHVVGKYHALTRTLEMSFEYLESKDGAAARALKLLAFSIIKTFVMISA